MRKPEVVLFEPDLIFSSKIEATAKRLNVDVRTVMNFEDLQRELDEGHSKVLLISLDSFEGKSAVLGKYLDEGMTVIGYYSHVKTHLAEEARRVGVQRVVSRGSFVSSIEEIFLEILGSN